MCGGKSKQAHAVSMQNEYAHAHKGREKLGVVYFSPLLHMRSTGENGGTPGTPGTEGPKKEREDTTTEL